MSGMRWRNKPFLQNHRVRWGVSRSSHVSRERGRSGKRGTKGEYGGAGIHPFIRNVLAVVFFFMLFTALTAMLAEWRLRPVIRMWGITRAENLATRSINLAVEETMAASISTSEMAILVRDNAGTLQGVQYDTGEINRVSTQATHRIQQLLSNLAEERFPIPLGQVTGLDFLSAWGPGIPVRIIPVGAVRTSPIGSFEAAGINQTWHRVLLDIQVTMRIVVPLMTEELAVTARIPIIEEVFIGAVPNWYFAPQSEGYSDPKQMLPLGGGSFEFSLID